MHPHGVRVDLLRLLLDHKADLNYGSHYIMPVLGRAAGSNDADCVRFLLGRGADPDGRPGLLRPIYEAIVFENVEMAGDLARAGASLSGLSAQQLAFVEVARASQIERPV